MIKTRLHSNKHKPKIKQELSNTKSTLPPNVQSFKQKLLSGSLLVEYEKNRIISIIVHIITNIIVHNPLKSRIITRILNYNCLYLLSKRDYLKIYHNREKIKQLRSKY